MLYYGENLQVLREHIGNESIDLIYIDPPFNSKATYNLLFKSPDTKEQSQSQITAFDDTWHWGKEAQLEYAEIVNSTNTNLAELIQALRHFLKENDLMAYLVMMASRLIELHRVLKPTGSIYLHCDTTASHYLKLVLDAVFGFENYRNEISWKRSQPKSLTTINFPNCRDVIFRYSKSKDAYFKKVYTTYNEEYLRKFYRFTDDKGRRYRLDNLANPNKNRPNLTYEFLGITRVWRWTKERMEKAYRDGLIHQSKQGAVPAYKRYLDEMSGQPITDDWDDIEHLHGSNSEFLGYPTQKPLALLERIIESSCPENGIVLDAFCGCGTAIHAAQKLNRNWIGIDITHLAISLIEKRLKDAFPDIKIEVEGTPKDLEAAKDLANRDKYQFQWWAVSLVNAVPFQNKKKGADSGIDGIIYFDDGEGHTGKYGKIIISVKGGEHINVGMIRDLKGTMEREKASIGLFITLAEPTAPMLTEAASAPLYASKVSPSKVFPTIQILTIKGLLEGTQRAEYPNLNLGTIGLKNTEKEEKIVKQDELF